MHEGWSACIIGLRKIQLHFPQVFRIENRCVCVWGGILNIHSPPSFLFFYEGEWSYLHVVVLCS